MANVGVEAKDHTLQAFPGPVLTAPPDKNYGLKARLA
jgi:hypothetical protein